MEHDKEVPCPDCGRVDFDSLIQWIGHRDSHSGGEDIFHVSQSRQELQDQLDANSKLIVRLTEALEKSEKEKGDLLAALRKINLGRHGELDSNAMALIAWTAIRALDGLK